MNIIHLSITASHESISRRARELWLELGKPPGADLSIWLQAEREIIHWQQDTLRAINQEQLQDAFDSFEPLSGRRGPTALDLT